MLFIDYQESLELQLNTYTKSISSMIGPVVDLQPLYSSQEEEQCQAVLSERKEDTSRLIQKSQSLMFNIKYNLMHSNFVHIPYFHRPKIILDSDSQPVCLLGQTYFYEKKQKFIQHFGSIIWMSYRSVSSSGKSDVGWGCMIRVVQMLIAQIIKRSNPSILSHDIIELFKQGKKHQLSLQNICASGNIKQRWTGSNQILMAVSSIINKMKFKNIVSISQKIPDQIKLDFNIQLYCEHFQIRNIEKMHQQEQFPKVIAISSKVTEEGCNSFPDIYSSHVKHLMRFSYFCGMIGGYGSQALYIVGFQDDKAICLDPHYVQDEKQVQKIRYYKKTPRGLAFTQLSQSITLCFYIKNIDEYKHWIAELCHAHILYAPYLAFGMDVESPQDMIQKYRKRSQDFQNLDC